MVNFSKRKHEEEEAFQDLDINDQEYLDQHKTNYISGLGKLGQIISLEPMCKAKVLAS